MEFLDRRTLMGLAAAAPAALALPDPEEVVPLWPGPPPGAPGILPREEVTDRVASSGFTDRYASKVASPTMTVFRPARPNGAACLVVPGGGYIRVVVDKEGFEAARRFAEAGVTAFVLRYRLPQDGWAKPAEAPLADAVQAMRVIRGRAAHFGVDPHRVLAIGFSAGGHVAAQLAARAPADARPDLSALLYPVISMARPFAHAGSRTALLGPEPTPQAEAAYSVQNRVTSETPPTFLVHAWDDASVPVENSLGYLAALRAARVSCEAHLFEEGGHGFGLRLIRGKPAEVWPDLLLAWAKRRGWLG